MTNAFLHATNGYPIEHVESRTPVSFEVAETKGWCAISLAPSAFLTLSHPLSNKQKKRSTTREKKESIEILRVQC